MPRKRAGVRLPPAHKRLRRTDLTEKPGSSQDKLEVPAARTPPKKAALQSVQPAEHREPAASTPHPQRDRPIPARAAGPQDFAENRRLVVRLVPVSCFGVGPRGFQEYSDDEK